MWAGSLGRENPLEKNMVSHSSVLAWKIPWTEEPDGLQSMELKRVRDNYDVSFFQKKHSFKSDFFFFK